MAIPSKLYATLLATLAALLTACGGGSSSNPSSAQQPTQTPVSKVMAQVTIVNGIATFSGARSNYTITKGSSGYSVTDNVGSDGTATYADSTRLKFTDTSVALDIDGTAGQIYRLYQAAFDRQPDSSGIGFQIAAIEVSGLTQTQVSQNFINSPEFSSKYGSLSNAQFVTQLYANVLHRSPDASGLAFHTGNLDSAALTTSQVLIGFSESPENKTQVLSAIQNGIQYAPYVTVTTPPPILVASADDLIKALLAVKEGDTIQLAAGTYVGTFKASVTGTASKPITLTGPATAILQNNLTSGKRYGLYLESVNYWVLDGFTVNTSQKGIVLDKSNFNTLQNLTVHNVEDEAIHFRSFSSDNTLKNSTIYNTGLVQPGFGEGVYLGSAKSNWSTYAGSATTPDASNRNTIINNKIGPNVAAEGIDVKEGTAGGLIQGNSFDGTGITGANFADSVMDVKGDSYIIKGNTVINTPTASSKFLLEGFQVNLNTVNSISYGHNNTFNGNTFDLNNSGNTSLNPKGYGINVKTGLTGTIVCSNNTAKNGNGSVTNINLTVCP